MTLSLRTLALRLFLAGSLMAFVASLFPAAQAASTRALRVVIDPGHGGHDTGARRGPIKESDISLRIAQDLSGLLDKDPRFASMLTRDADRFLTLEQRTAFAEQNKADLLLSIHANASPDPRAQGAEFYFQNLLGADEESMFLANRENAAVEPSGHAIEGASARQKSDLAQILEDLQRNRKLEVSSALSHIFVANWNSAGVTGGHRSSMVRQAPFFVVSQTTMPAVLVEVGFVSHLEEGPRLAGRERQKEIARHLYESLIQFKTQSDGGAL